MSKEKKQTPGPWHVEDIRPCATENIAVFNPLLGVCTDGDDAVAICGRRNEEFVQANARLIAAAPELLEALEEVVEYHEGRGKYNFSKLFDEERANAAYDAWQDIWRKKIHPAIAKALGE